MTTYSSDTKIKEIDIYRAKRLIELIQSMEKIKEAWDNKDIALQREIIISHRDATDETFIRKYGTESEIATLDAILAKSDEQLQMEREMKRDAVPQEERERKVRENSVKIIEAEKSEIEFLINHIKGNFQDPNQLVKVDTGNDQQPIAEYPVSSIRTVLENSLNILDQQSDNLMAVEADKLLAIQYAATSALLLAESSEIVNEPVSEALARIMFEALYLGESSSDVLDLPHIPTISTKTLFFVNCKVENKIKEISRLAAINKPDSDYNISVAVVPKQPKRNEVLVNCTLSFDSENVTYSREITEYDRLVATAVTSLYVTGKKENGDQSDVIITPTKIYLAENGITTYADPPNEAIRKIAESMDRLARTFVRIDCSEEAKQRGMIDKNGRFVIEDALISATKVTAVSGGIAKTAYRINACPVLYKYASTINKQVLHIDPRLLDIHTVKDNKPCKRIPNTTLRTLIKSYIVRRIEIMKGGSAGSHRILYSTLYTEIGVDTPTKTERSRIRSYVEQVLEYQRSVSNIKGFEPVRSGRSIVGVDIKL